MKILKLDDRLSLIYTKNFPRIFARNNMKHTAMVGIGGNIGNVALRFEKVVNYLQKAKRINILQTSPLLKNPPFGFLKQADFLNSLLLIQTDLKPHDLMRYLLWVEKRFGRKRSFKNAPRTLDLDMIFYDNIHLRSRRLVLPHPHFEMRESVMIPLQYIRSVHR